MKYRNNFEMFGGPQEFNSVEEFARAICACFPKSYKKNPVCVTLCEGESSDLGNANEVLWESELYALADSELRVQWDDFVTHCAKALEVVESYAEQAVNLWRDYVADMSHTARDENEAYRWIWTQQNCWPGRYIKPVKIVEVGGDGYEVNWSDGSQAVWLDYNRDWSVVE